MPGSKDWGAVPSTSVTVPPELDALDLLDAAAELVVLDADELDELLLPHAPIAIAAMTVSNDAANGLT